MCLQDSREQTEFEPDTPTWNSAAKLAARCGVDLREGLVEVVCEPHDLGSAFWRITQACTEISGLYQVHERPLATATLRVRVAKAVVDFDLPFELGYEIQGRIG